MRQFIKYKDICFHEEDFNKLIYGRSQKYKSLDLDFDTNVLPYLLSEKLKRVISWITNYENDQQRNWELAKCLIEILSEMVIFNKGPSGISVNDDFIDIMENADDLCFFASDIKTTETSNESKSLLELANESMYTQEHIDVMDFLYRVDGDIRIRANYPQSLYDLIYEALTCLLVICMKHPDQAAKHIKVTPNEIINTEEEAYKIKEYVRFDNGVLVFEDIEFKTSKDANLIRDLFLLNPENCIRAVCFIRCHFNSPEISFSVNPLRMYFKECIFEKQVSFRNTDNRIEFDTCLFYGTFRTFRLEDLWIHHSTFELGSSLLIKDNQLFTFEDVIIKGKLEIEAEEIELKWNNVSLFEPFEVKSAKLNPLSEIQNIAFVCVKSSKMNKSRKDLFDVMKNAGLEEQAKAQGLSIEEAKKDFDLNAYKVAYESGRLKSEYAAYFLEMSVSNLEKKRKKDRENPSRDSIPFTGEGKNIKYPVEALQAYKSEDWDTLRELRQKYKEKELKEKNKEIED